MDARIAFVELPTPLGPLLVTGAGGALTGAWFADGARRPPAADRVRDPSPFAAVAEQLAAYFAGERRAFALPLRPAGTPFEREVWTALRAIPYGETLTYGELARRLGRPRAARAVGRANGRNPLSVLVPCHRLVGTRGALAGYAGGLERKRRLLDLERAALSPSA